MLDKFQELCNKYYPIKELTEMFVQYYGEENRQVIEERLNNAKPIFVTESLSSVDIKEAFQKVYLQYSPVL